MTTHKCPKCDEPCECLMHEDFDPVIPETDCSHTCSPEGPMHPDAFAGGYADNH